MKIDLHRLIVEQQKFDCTRCARCCRSLFVAVSAPERDRIDELRNWREQRGVDELFVRSPTAGPRFGLAKRPDGRCVFLDDDNLCSIHKLHGPAAKPIACQAYPFALAPFQDRLCVTLRFDCPAVLQCTGRNITAHRGDLQRLAKVLAPDAPAAPGSRTVTPGRTIPPERIETLNELLLKIVQSDAMSLYDRLCWFRLFVEHLRRLRWSRLSDEEFEELMPMLHGGSLGQLQHEAPPAQPIAPRARKLLGQIFFLLAQPPTAIPTRREGFAATWRNRMEQKRAARQLRSTSGPLPPIQPDWPQCDIAQLEHSFGPWPADVDQMLTRYLTCRIAAMSYCGPSFYGYSLTEGADTLLLAIVTAGWLMRIHAAKAGRSRIELPDSHAALMTIDGNVGYSRPLGFGPSRLRLSYLRDHLAAFLDRYCH
jgi:Fe-S-cluster containining protein